MVYKIMKKADANMWWIIIGAVLALIVLIVLMVLFTGKTGKFGVGVSGCESKGGVCVGDTSACPARTFSSPAFDCAKEQTCCFGSPKECNDIDKACDAGEQCSTDIFNGKRYCFS